MMLKLWQARRWMLGRVPVQARDMVPPPEGPRLEDESEDRLGWHMCGRVGGGGECKFEVVFRA
eukprot:4261138-Alexandrium_andersonii.AAC.1